jgi:1-phosphofructokinase
MIITVTLNPALDKTAELDLLRPGELNRLKNVITDIGGKGVNVSKMIAALGGGSIATGFAGGGSGAEIVNTLTEMGISADFVKVGCVTRKNIKILDKGNRLTELNEPGVTVTPDEIERLKSKLSGMANPKSIFVFAGSLAVGLKSDFYAELIHIVHKNGALAFLDADGDAFKAALKEKPDFIKPNRHEIMEYFGINGPADLEVLKGLCGSLVKMGVPRIALSMGAEGAMFVNDDIYSFSSGLEVSAHSSVGAGDSMVGAVAFAADKGMSWKDACDLAMAASAGAVTTKGTNPPTRALVEVLLKQVKQVKL